MCHIMSCRWEANKQQNNGAAGFLLSVQTMCRQILIGSERIQLDDWCKLERGQQSLTSGDLASRMSSSSTAPS